MKIIYNCFAGISGEMNLAAMLDLGMDIHVLKSELSKLGLNDEFELEAFNAEKNGINGTQVRINLKHKHHHHNEEHHRELLHRSYTDIETIINHSDLNNEIKTIALKIYWEIAIAEGKVHNKSPKEIHFEEAGLTDSIVNIVGAAICYHLLGIKHVISTVPELGGGFMTCQHGKMPVPRPTTVEILHNINCSTGATQKEMTTPIGAAILKILSNEWIAYPQINTKKTAYGIGLHQVEIPHVLRIYEYEDLESFSFKKNTMIECNIDDMTAEDLARIPDLMIANGALEAFLTPIIMEKGRPGTQLSVICEDPIKESLNHLILTQTLAIELRYYEVTKSELKHCDKKLQSQWGIVHYTESTLLNGKKRIKFEYEDIKRISGLEDLPISAIRRQLFENIK